MPVFKPGPESDEDRGAKFRWLTRAGIGRHFGGGLPIGWYQAHQMCAINEIEARAVRSLRMLHFAARDDASRVYSSEPFEVTTRGGMALARRQGGRRWTTIGSVRELFDAADRCARR